MSDMRIGGAAPGGQGLMSLDKTPAQPKPKSFVETMKDSIEQVQKMQEVADGEVQKLATGGNTTIHQTMIALEQADISFRMLNGVRGKVVAAYQEIMRMQF